MKRPSIFRQAALKQLYSPDQLDQLIQIVPSRAWLIMAAFLLLLLVFIGWLIWGSIPTRAQGSGILLAGGGDVYQAVAPDGPSRVDQILVSTGAKVKKGQGLAVLSRPDLTTEITVTQTALTELNRKYQNLSTLAAQETSLRLKEIAKQRQAISEVLANNEKKLKNAAGLLAARQQGLREGVETRQNVDLSLQSYYGIKSDIDTSKDQLAQLEIAQNNFIDEWRERLRELALKITDEKTKLANLEARRTLSTLVVSPVDGQVITVQAAVGSVIKTGEAIINVASKGQGLDALLFLPPHMGKRVKPGMEALISPGVVEKAEFGSIYGKVIKVAAFPATSAAMEAILQNPQLVKKFSEKEVPLEIRVHLQMDPATYSRLKWTSSQGPRQKITPGTLATGFITIRTQPPGTLIIPLFKTISGSE